MQDSQNSNDNYSNPVPFQNTPLHQYDSTFTEVFSGLSDLLLKNVQSSVKQVLDLSENFLNEDVSKAIHDFHHLYESSVDIHSYKDQIDQNVDKLIDFIQNNSNTDAKKEEELLNQFDDEQISASRLSFAALQKDMEALITLEEDIKDKVMPILHGLQFEDQMSSNIRALDKSLKGLLELLYNGESTFDADKAAHFVLDNLHSAKEREFFIFHVFHQDFHYDADEGLLDGLLHTGDLGVQEFLRRIQQFASASLQWCNEQSAHAVSAIMDIITCVQERAESIENFSAETQETVDQLRKLTANTQFHEAGKETTRFLINNLQNKLAVDDKINYLIKPIITAVQFQDRICQNMANMSGALEAWLTSRATIIQTSPTEEDPILTLGEQLMNIMTMPEERDIIREHIEGLPEPQQNDGFDCDLF